MTKRARSLVVAAIVAALPGVVASQSAPITLDSVLIALHAGAVAIRFDTLDRGRNAALDSLTALLRATRAADLTIDDFIAGTKSAPHSVLEIFRWDRDKVARSSQPALQSAFVRLQQITLPRPDGLGPRIFSALGAPGYRTYASAMDSLQTRAILVVQGASTEKLRRYEMKYGPASPRLNPIETVVNYGLERIPGLGFAPGPDGPSPLEFVATYSNSEVTPTGTFKNVDLRVLSGVHVGLRIYAFDTTASRSPLSQLLHPGSVALGASAFAPSDVPLQSPLRAGRRWGAFLDWGHLRAAAALGHDWRAMIGTGAQLIPHLF